MKLARQSELQQSTTAPARPGTDPATGAEGHTEPINVNMTFNPDNVDAEEYNPHYPQKENPDYENNRVNPANDADIMNNSAHSDEGYETHEDTLSE